MDMSNLHISNKTTQLFHAIGFIRRFIVKLGGVGVLVAVAVAANAFCCWAWFMLMVVMMAMAMTKPRPTPAIILKDGLSN